MLLGGTLRFEVGPLGGWGADGRVARRFDGGLEDERFFLSGCQCSVTKISLLVRK